MYEVLPSGRTSGFYRRQWYLISILLIVGRSLIWLSDIAEAVFYCDTRPVVVMRQLRECSKEWCNDKCNKCEKFNIVTFVVHPLWKMNNHVIVIFSSTSCNEKCNNGRGTWDGDFRKGTPAWKTLGWGTLGQGTLEWGTLGWGLQEGG